MAFPFTSHGLWSRRDSARLHIVREDFIRNTVEELLKQCDLLRSQVVDTEKLDCITAAVFRVCKPKLKMPLRAVKRAWTPWNLDFLAFSHISPIGVLSHKIYYVKYVVLGHNIWVGFSFGLLLVF